MSATVVAAATLAALEPGVRSLTGKWIETFGQHAAVADDGWPVLRDDYCHC